MALQDPKKTCSCDQGHLTYGACLRDKGLGFVGVFETRTGGVSADASKAWDRRLDQYRAARRQGVQPKSTKSKDTENAMKISNHYGQAFNAGPAAA